MPDTKGQLSAVPDDVKERLNPKCQKVWIKAYNQAISGEGVSDQRARKAANAVVTKSGCKDSSNGSNGSADKAKDDDYEIFAKVESTDDEQQIFFGWAYVASKDGTMVRCHGGEDAPIEELEKAVYPYVKTARVGGEMHVKMGGGTLVESVIFTPEKIAKMGLPANTPSGWWVGYHVEDEELWKGVKSGKYPMLSIGGRAKRRDVAMDKAGDDPAPEFSNAIEAAEHELDKVSPADWEDNTWGYLDLITASVRTEVESVGMRAYQFGGEILEEFAKPYPKGPVSAPHGPSIKCPNIYEALRRKGKSKKNAAQISNECWKSPKCKCT